MTRETGIQYHVDHIIPICKGGKHHQDNLQILTGTENLKKGTKIL
jgi:5-methylcytosine-specific restriction endonuclease McrA